MATVKQNINGSAIYDKIFPLLDYCGSIRQNEKSQGQNTYNALYSPNNIKRLIISPDCVEMHYHVQVPNKGLVDRVRISSQQLAQLYMSCPDYKPMMSVLCTKHICASVEEVILLVNSNDGQVRLSGRELSFDNLVSSFVSKKGSLEETIKARYRRLHDFTVVNMNYNMFMQNLRSVNVRDYDFICDMPFMKGVANTKIVNNDSDWYAHWGSSGQVYDMDKVGGKLHKHFTDLKLAKESKSKADAVKAVAKERNASLEKEVKELLSRYKLADKIQSQLSKLDKMCGWNNLLVTRFSWIPLVPLYECEAIKGYPNTMKSTSEGQALKDNKELLQNAFISIVENLAQNLLSATAEVGKISPITLKVMMNEVETTVIVPQNCINYGTQIATITGVAFNGKDLRMSLVNSSWLICLFYLDRTSEGWNPKYINREFWKGALSC